MAQMLHEIAGVVPKEVVVLTDPRSGDYIGGRSIYDGGVKGSAWIVQLGWAVHNCRLTGSKERLNNRDSEGTRN